MQPTQDNQSLADRLKAATERSIRWYHENRDPEENAATTLPDGESVQLHFLWVTELYLPSQHQNLLTAVRDLGWSDHGSAGGESLEAWLNAATANVSVSGWRNLNVITRPDDETQFIPLMDGLHADLPHIAQYAIGYIDQILPGLLAVNFQLVLTDETAGRLALEVATERQAHYEQKSSQRWSLHSPFHQKRDAAQRVREQLYSEASDWLAAKMPGYFSALGAHKLPTVEFVTFARAKPFEQLPNSKWFNYVEALGMGGSLGCWSCLELDGLRLSTDFSGGDPFRLVMAAREGDLIPDGKDDHWQVYGGRTRDGYSNRLSLLHRVPTVRAIEALVLTWEVTLSKIRNRVASVDLHKPSSVAELQAVQLNLLSLSRDLLPITSELIAFAAERERFEWELPDCAPLHDFPPPEMRLFDQMRKGIAMRTARVVRLEAEIREAASAQALLAATREQSRATGSMVALTKAIAILTVILVVLTLVLALQALA